MKTVRCTLVSASPYGQSGPIQSVRSTGETHDAFEERTWRERMHLDENGQMFIPPQALKNCLSETAKFLSESVPGKGKATYTKHFEAGLMVIEPIKLGIKGAEVKPLRMFVPSDGKRGGGSRVWKNFPVIQSWKGIAEIVILDPVLLSKTDKIEEYLGHAGKFIGLGWFRPRNNGYYGRFTVEKFEVLNGK